MEALEEFRQEARTWLDENCPPGMRLPQDGVDGPAWGSPEFNEAADLWRVRMAEKGWTCPTWPVDFGGGGLDPDQTKVLRQEMNRIGTSNPVMSFGTHMLGPVLLEYASDEQKKRFLPDITAGKVVWAQGYSEPGSGSDLASLQTRAVRDGDEFVINGQKIWTTNADQADWMFCLVRTDPDAPKHEGISFILFDLKSQGVTISPIELISGRSEFCEVFFDNVRARADNLVGNPGDGWTIAKKLLQHERSMISGTGGAGGGRQRQRPQRNEPAHPIRGLADLALPYVGDENGKLADASIRARATQAEMDGICLALTAKRNGEEARKTKGPGHAASMFKWYATELNKRREELKMSFRGYQALGWDGDGFSPQELQETRHWLRSKGNSIEGGTSEIQMNVIAKRVLGLPD